MKYNKMYHITVSKNDVTLFSTQDYIEEHANKILYLLTDVLDDSYKVEKINSSLFDKIRTHTYHEKNINAYIEAIECEYNI